MAEQKRLYLAGPMRGLPDLNRPTFHAAATRWRMEGWWVFNPAEADGDQNVEAFTDEQVCRCRRLDLFMLIGCDHEGAFDRLLNPGCDALAVLPGWNSSQGAQLETTVAAYIGIPILDVENPIAPEDCP